MRIYDRLNPLENSVLEIEELIRAKLKKKIIYFKLHCATM
jgi:hypothetical protein